MKIKKNLCFFFLYLFSTLSWGQMQYAPLASVERHELSSGFSVSIKNWQENPSSKIFPVFFLKYTLYFPEISSYVPKPYQKIFIPGFTAGANLFRSQKQGKNYGICKTDEGIYPSTYYLGLKGKMAYFEFLQPFAEFGLARSSCYSKNFSKFFKAKRKLSHYFSYGFFLSLKILDRMSIYTLDQDHGINDVGVKTECLYHPKTEKNKSLSFCQFGLQLSF